MDISSSINWIPGLNTLDKKTNGKKAFFNPDHTEHYHTEPSVTGFSFWSYETAHSISLEEEEDDHHQKVIEIARDNDIITDDEFKNITVIGDSVVKIVKPQEGINSIN